jgi:hypothetical protein
MEKLSLLFLTYSNIIHIDTLKDYLENANIYIHPKYPDKVNEELKKYIIPRVIETKWGDKSIVEATLELLEEAFKNANNSWFILCSEDIYPLVSYTDLFNYLSQETKSIFDVMDSAKNKTSQFWALNRTDVSSILSNRKKWNTIFQKIHKKSAYDELFFLPLLKSINPSYSFKNSKFCYVKWFKGFVSKHPTTFNCLLSYDSDSIESNHSCFIRKTYPTFKNTICQNKEYSILLVYGSLSITDYDQFLSDFSEIANIFILSMNDKVDNEDLIHTCCQTYYVVWNELDKAIDEISKTLIGKTIITSEKLNVNKLKNLLKESRLQDDDDNTFKINFDISSFINVSEPDISKSDISKPNKTDINISEPNKSDTSVSEILLSLGDIIIITDPTNEILNNNVFLIEYIDPTKMKLINSETFEKIVLQISSDGIIGDGNIQSIKVIGSNPKRGYARQNDLLPGTWINIYFGGEIPAVITGKITNLEEDMIEIKTIDKDTIFINFAYQGIPEDLPIETFEIRPAIEQGEGIEGEGEGEGIEGEGIEGREGEEGIEGREGEEGIERIEGIEKIPKEVVKNKVKRMFFDVNDIEFGDAINVEEFITIDKDKYRYNIETQTNDLLEEMISTIPNYKRTNNVLNSIHIMIMRFLQLRQISSTFDINKNITGIIKHTAEDRPLAEYLSEFKNSLYWIMMVAKNVKKIYPSGKSDYKRYDDYETLKNNTELLSMSDLYVTRKSTRTDKTIYSQFTYQPFEELMTPFYSIDTDSANDVFNRPNGIIVEGNVETNINAIIDNLGDLYSTVVGNSNIVNRRFIIQKYNLAYEKLHANNFKGQNLIAHRVKVAPNDPISINSIITLPEPTVRFSQVNLPGSNLLVKANLNLHFLNYWQLLKQRTELTKITIDGLDNELEYDDTNFVDNIKQYILDLTEYERPQELTNLDIYKVFLKIIIPKIRVLFKLVKKYIKGRLSLVDVVNYLEPFMIYPIDLTFMQYREINNFIYQKIKEYNSKFKEYSTLFASLRHIRSKGGLKEVYVFKNPLFDILSDKENFQFQSQIMDIYGYTGPITISGSEFLKNITVADYGNLYNTAVAFTNIQLMFPNNLSEVFDKDKDRMKQIMEKDKKADKCSNYIIAKKYYSLESLTADNEKTIYYDKEFDTTNYELISEKYKKERDELTKDELIFYLTEQLKKKDKLDDVSAEYMATTLVNQAKAVREGDYGILVTTREEQTADQLEYYVRKDDIWVLDKEVDPKTFIKEDDVLCNIDYSCMYNAIEKKDDKCVSTDVAKDTVIQNALKQIIDQFDKKYEISKTELNARINSQLEYFKANFERLQQWKYSQLLKYNNYQYDIGLSIVDEIREKKVSPYAKLRDLIMGQNDFIKRQSDIIRFVSSYCYEGNPEIPNINDGEMEDEWWFYCKDTNTKLLPKFHYILAFTFINNNSKYDDVLNELKRKIGKRSDDGDAWVDEHSGEIICYIDLDVSESYKEGFVDKSRDIMEKDAGEIMLEKLQEKRIEKPNKRLSVEGEIVSNIISVMSSNMGIDIESSRELIIRVVSELMSDTKVIEREPAYKKREEEAAKKGKSLPSYGSVYSSTILYLTLGMYLIAIQTSIPSIRTRKTAPGCVRSFVGFPFAGEGDDSSLIYVACVAIKSRDPSTNPWKVLPKNEEKIVNTLKNFIIKFLLTHREVIEKIKEKTEYLLTSPEEFIPEEHDISKWLNFLPPLKRFHVNHLENVSEGFKDELQNELFTGSHRQLEKLLIIESKIISFSLAIQEAIQQIIEKKNLLLKSAGQFFMDNACCNEREMSSMTSLQYFINDDKSIEVYNNTVLSLSALLHDIKILTEGALMLSKIDTKRKFPTLSNDFSEETIYQAFIVLCKFQTSIPLSEELSTICIDKPDYLKKLDSIQEKISKLKRDGRNYTKEQFLRLFQIVSRNNIIKISLFKKDISCTDYLKKLLVTFDEEDEQNVPKVFVQKLEILLEMNDLSISEDPIEMREMKNYLQKSIDKMRTETIDFIKLKGNLSSAKIKNINTFLLEISNWRFNEDIRNIDIKISDDALYNYTNFMKNFIELFVTVFPSMIMHENVQNINIPAYWGLSDSHENDIIEMITSFYEPIQKFYGNENIKNVVNEIMIKSRGIYLLSQSTPILTNIKIGDKEKYNVFDKRMTTLLYEYYFFSVMTDYIYLTIDPNMVNKLLVMPNKDDRTETFAADFLIEQQQRFAEDEEEIIEGNLTKLKQEIANLLISYLEIMMRSKKTINVSYKDIADKMFKLKEAEKYDFTDKLKDMTDEERAVDTILKHHKLGELYSLGMSKGIKEYDPEHFEHDKRIAENVTKIQNQLRKNVGIAEDIDMDDAIDEIRLQQEINEDLAMDMNQTDDYDDGDPWGDEVENREDYD